MSFVTPVKKLASPLLITPALAPFESLVALNHPPQLPNKLANFLKNAILYHRESPDFPSFQASPLFPNLCSILLQQMLDPKQNESSCQLLGNLFMAYFEFFAKQRSQQMIAALIRKLYKSALPTTNQGIVVYLSFLILSYSPDMLQFLGSLDVDKKNGLKILMDHWLLHLPKFAGNLSKLHSVRGLVHIYR